LGPGTIPLGLLVVELPAFLLGIVGIEDVFDGGSPGLR
jgi:hypothetical protein